MYELPPKPAHEYVCMVKDRLATRAVVAAIGKITPIDKTNGNLPYEELVCTEIDKANIFEIITAMADNSKLSLLFMAGHLKQLGAEIDHVHPLKFLSTIMTNPRLRMSLNEVMDDYFKRIGFFDGLSPSLSKEADKGKLDQYAAPFAQEINVPVEAVQEFFKARNWEEFVRYLLRS